MNKTCENKKSFCYIIQQIKLFTMLLLLTYPNSFKLLQIPAFRHSHLPFVGLAVMREVYARSQARYATYMYVYIRCLPNWVWHISLVAASLKLRGSFVTTIRVNLIDMESSFFVFLLCLCALVCAWARVRELLLALCVSKIADSADTYHLIVHRGDLYLILTED